MSSTGTHHNQYAYRDKHSQFLVIKYQIPSTIFFLYISSPFDVPTTPGYKNQPVIGKT